MAPRKFTKARSLITASALALGVMAAPLASPLAAETIFSATTDGFSGQVRAGAAEPGQAIVAGSKVSITGERLIPGQQVTLMRGNTVLNEGGPITVDNEGKFRFDLTLDKAAVTGLQPILVIAENPSSATVVDLKISPDLAIQGAEKFDIASAPVTRGLYQLAYSPSRHAFYVTSAVGRPPVRESALSKVDPDTLDVVAQITPGAAPVQEGGPAPAADDDGRPALYAVYGLGLNETTGELWTTNTRQNTIAVYKADDLALVKQFEPDFISHPFSIQVDEAAGRIYISAARSPVIEVIDAKTHKKLEPYTIPSQLRGQTFGTQDIHFDAKTGKLFAASNATPELAVIDTKTGEIRVTPLPGSIGAASVAYDNQDDLIFVASQGTDNLLIVNGADGAVLHDVETGANALYVTFEPKSRLAFVGNRGAGTITVVDTEGKVVANLDAGSLPNELVADSEGTVWAVNKSRGENDDSGDRIWRIRPKAE
ncbi:ATP-binding protein [Xinfangfangia sp. D13-10-4-6]|uniref:Vgb family protein n=1 Tax=Pseudogemmobacter hezensis TaxID=2737662 RepID=UPI0015541D39|nr:ATP-binding protein [Pseudogemmobacter hezensis]NPD13839.1 ATP-binding protein [Pseudogemmobacter hezensis]